MKNIWSQILYISIFALNILAWSAKCNFLKEEGNIKIFAIVFDSLQNYHVGNVLD